MAEIGLNRGSAVSARKWPKSRKRVLKVSDEIKSAVQAKGYYLRNLRATEERMIDVE
jgi:hypothetical protein